MTSLNKAAQLLGAKGGKTTGSAKSRSVQLKAWWSGVSQAQRKARLERMAEARRKKFAERC